MPSQPKRLVELAMRLFDEAPWYHAHESCVFLIQVPGQPRPFGCTVFGAGVDIKGIEIALSPNGFRRYLDLHDPATADEDIEDWKPGKSLSAVFLLKHQVAPEFRKVWKAAGFKTAGHPMVPQFAGTEGDGSDVRPIKRSEGTILGYCMHAILEAIREHRLAPPDAADRTGATLLLTVDGDDPDEFEAPDLPEVKCSMAPWPDDLGRVPTLDPIPDEVAEAIRALPAADENFALFTFVTRGAPEHGLEDGDLVAVLIEGDERRLVDHPEAPAWHPVVLEGPLMLNDALLHLLQAAGRRPASIAMEDPALAAWLIGIEKKVGVRSEYYEFEEALADAADECTENLGGVPLTRAGLDALEFGDEEPMPPDEFPAQLNGPDDWAAGHTHIGFVVGAAAEELGLEGAAISRYWGTRKDMRRVLELVGFMGAGHAFRSYVIEDDRGTGSEKTAVELAYEAASQLEGDEAASEEELQCYRARRDASVSVFRIGGDEVVDVLDGETYRLDIELGPVARFDNHVMVLRRYALGPYCAFAPAGPALADEAEEYLLQQVEAALGAPPTHELLRAKGDQLGRLWKDLVGNIESALNAAQSDS